MKMLQTFADFNSSGKKIVLLLKVGYYTNGQINVVYISIEIKESIIPNSMKAFRRNKTYFSCSHEIFAFSWIWNFLLRINIFFKFYKNGCFLANMNIMSTFQQVHINLIVTGKTLEREKQK